MWILVSVVAQRLVGWHLRFLMEASNNLSPSGDSQTELLIKTIADEFAGRYEIRAISQRFTDLVVADGEEIETGTQVSLLSAVGFSSSELLRAKFRLSQLSQVSSPHLRRVFDSSVSEKGLVLVEAAVTGERLESLVSDRLPSVSDALGITKGVLLGLRDLHQRELMHLSLRPHLIWVDSGSVTLWNDAFDFRDSASTGEDSIDRAKFVSPEQAGLIERDVTFSSDLYSVGAVLHYLLTGRAPFEAKNLNALLLSHMVAPLPELDALACDNETRVAIQAVLHRLLAKDPSDRYQTSEAVLCDVEQLEGFLNGGADVATFVPGTKDARTVLREPAFVARQSEITTIREAIRECHEGTPGLVLLEGESGGGKSRMLGEIYQFAASSGLRIYRGQGINDVTNGAFSVFEGVVDDLVTQTKTAEGVGDQTWQMGDELANLVALFPKLQSIAPPGLSIADLVNERSNEFAPGALAQSLTVFLNSLGSPDHPAVVILDDCQWACEQTIAVLRRWLADLENVQHLLVVLAFRSEEVASDSELRRLRATEHVRLVPLSDDEVGLLVESMAGSVPGRVRDLVQQAAEGSPFMAVATMRGLEESGAICFRDSLCEIRDEAAFNACQSSGRAGEFLSRRLDMLSKETLALLSDAAVLGKEFVLQTVIALSEADHVDSMQRINEARSRHMVWMRDGNNVAFAHDKIREALLARLPAEAQARTHLRVAKYLEANQPGRAGRIAIHYDAAKRADLALPYAVQAGKQAQSENLPSPAKAQFEIAERGLSVSEADRETEFTVHRRLGELHTMLGNYTESEAYLRRALAIAEGKMEQARILGLIGDTTRRRGELESAAESYEAALDLLGHQVPKSSSQVLLKLCREAAIQLRNTYFSRRFVNRLRRPPNDAERLETFLLSGLTHTYWYIRSKQNTVWAHFRGLNRAERFEPSLELAGSYSEHAPCMTLLGLFERAFKYADRSYQIRESFNDLWGQGNSRCFQAIAYYAASKYDEAIAMGREAIRLLEQAGDFWNIHIARFQIAGSMLYQGRFDEARRLCEKNYASAIETKDEASSGIILDLWAKSTHGDIPVHVLEEELARPRFDVQGRCHVLMAKTYVLLRNEDHDGALEAIEEAVRVTTEADVKNCYTLPAYALRTRVLREMATNATECARGYERARLLRRAFRGAIVGLLNSWASKNEVPNLLYEMGLIRAMQGRPRQARWFLLRSRASAKRVGAGFVAAQAAKELGELGKQLGWPAADALFREGQDFLNRVEFESRAQDEAQSRETISLTDRFDTVIKVGRSIAGTYKEKKVYKKTVDAARRLLRCEACSVIKVSGTSFEAVRGELEQPYRESILKQVAQSGKPVATFLVPPKRTGGEGKGSLLCTPIFVLGELTSLIYATHSGVHDLFGDDEIQLSQFVATIAGASLEGANSYEQLRELNLTLEDRVAERTEAAESRAQELAISNDQLTVTAHELRLTEEQLREAVAEANAANEAKSRFLATMSHEIRTPMNGILGMAELALATKLNAKQSKYINVVKQSGKSLMGLLNEILDHSKIEAGKLELEDTPFDLRNVVENVVQLLSPLANEKGLELICELDRDLPISVIGDSNRVRQIIVNLVGNAIKFTSEGEIRVAVRRSEDCNDAKSNDAEWIEFEVRDTGIGIAPAKCEAVFDAFQQEDSSTTRKYGGTGLGLSICQQLANLMGGRIELESKQGAGSKFSLCLPLNSVGSQTQHDLTDERLRGLTMLLVGERTTTQIASQKLFETLGLQVATFSSLDELEADMVEAIDLVALDEPTVESLTTLQTWGANNIVALVRSGTDLECEVEYAPIDKPLSLEEVREVVAFAIGGPDVATRVDRVENELVEPPLDSSDSGAILVVDDTIVNQEVVRGLLELEGFQVDTALSGLEALKAAKKKEYDLILMDIEMPEMDGIEATRAILDFADMPIVAMSAHAVSHLQDRCGGHNLFAAFVTKPCSPQTLVEVLNELLSRRADA